jgi:molybdenum cofactor biosynthesis enzyme MoaA
MNDLKYKQKFYNLPSVKTDITNICSVPWNSVSIDQFGRIFICWCDGYVPFTVGHINDFNSFNDIFNSNQAIIIQKSILDKTYKYCATDVCGIKFKNSDKSFYLYLNLNLDISCNLSCPSCRETMTFIKDTDILQEKLDWVIKIKQWIANIDRTVSIELAGGEPFASLIYNKIFDELIDLPNVIFRIRTNGTLISSRKNIIDKLIHKINLFSISIDAACKETYEIVRRGGRWEHLIEGLEYLKLLNKPLVSNFVVQKNNLNDIIPFIEFSKTYNLTPAYTLVQDWGTWHNFNEQCVHIPSSPYYKKFQIIIKELQSLTNNQNIMHLYDNID